MPVPPEYKEPFRDSDPKSEEVFREFNENLRKTPEGVQVPHAPKDNGSIYVHTKALIVDQIFAMLGSANHNERSMWHDTEDMLAVRGFQKEHFPGKLRTDLMSTVLSGNMPDGDSGQEIFDHFTMELERNVTAYQAKSEQPSLIFPYIPKAAVGIFVIT